MSPLGTNKQDDTDAKSGTDLGISATVGDHATHHNALATQANLYAADAVNVLDPVYGVTGDGTTDDTAEIQAAITAAGVGGTVWFPKPSVSYKTTAALTITNARVTLLGSPGAEINNPNNVNVFTVTAADVVFEGLTIRGNATPVYAGGNLIAFDEGANRCKVRNCRLLDPPSFCIRFFKLVGGEVSGCHLDPNRTAYEFGTTPDGDGVFLWSCVQVRVVNNYFTNGINAIWGGTQDNVVAGDENDSYNRDIVILGNVFYNNWSHVVYVYGKRITIANNAIRHDRVAAPLQTQTVFKCHGTHFNVIGNTVRCNRVFAGFFESTHILVSGNDITITGNDNVDGMGFERSVAGSIDTVLVTGNKIVCDAATGRDGIYVNNTYDAGGGGAKRITITNNHVENFAQDGINVISPTATKGETVIISGNTILNVGQYAVRVSEATNVTVSDNVCYRPGVSGVQLDGVITRAVVASNHVVDDQGSPTIDQGINVTSSSSTEVSVRDNKIVGPTTANLVVFAATTNGVIDDAGGFKVAVRVATTAAVTLPPGGTTLTIDSVSLANGDRVLVKDQSTANAAQHGIYSVSGIGTSVVLTRTGDAATAVTLFDGAVIRVSQGTINADTAWQLVTDAPITLGTTTLSFSRIWPNYMSSPLRSPWMPGATAPLVANMDRETASAGVPQTAISAISSFHGGIVLPAGKTITNVNAFCTAAGSGSVTLFWFAIIRLDTRAVLERTANSTSLPTINAVHSRALQATITLNSDTPAYVVWAMQVATTSPQFAGSPAGSATLNATVPLMTGNSSTTPTSTPATVGAVLGNPAAGNTQRIFFWLT